MLGELLGELGGLGGHSLQTGGKGFLIMQFVWFLVSLRRALYASTYIFRLYIVLLGSLNGLGVLLLPLGNLRGHLVGQILDQTAGLAVLGGLGQLGNCIGQLAGVRLRLRLDECVQLSGIIDAGEGENLGLQGLDGIVGLLDNIGQG